MKIKTGKSDVFVLFYKNVFFLLVFWVKIKTLNKSTAWKSMERGKNLTMKLIKRNFHLNAMKRRENNVLVLMKSVAKMKGKYEIIKFPNTFSSGEQ